MVRTVPYLLDRVMAEGSLYAPELAALAIAQSGGDLYEAVLLLRAYRNTQPRLGTAELVRTGDFTLTRRISAAFRDVPGGQYLGPTLDYSHRLLRIDALTEDVTPAAPSEATELCPTTFPSVAEWLRGVDLLPGPSADVAPTEELVDVARTTLTFPAPRALRLQAMARADTGGLLTLGYSGMRGYGASSHPTVNELGMGYAEVRVPHPSRGTSISAGRVRVSFAEVVSPFAGGDTRYGLGFAAALGWNEVKVISAAMLDLEMDRAEAASARDEEFVLLHTDPVEASGFCIHYKLPHYVTFLSSLDAVRGARRLAQETDGSDGSGAATPAATSAVEDAATGVAITLP
jgi:alpha-D-ribose 1-methylphosphonate 5-triphosphate synthase subunit PhnI